ncbi:Nucleolar protein 58 [Coniochaeta pulveracea]|uniref:Nucleolar protein 58 n=1 Tax=Coniochaeta pulveracea TaxID=177199 RepID=A0A420Y805_9PEZI|nr:Nucleolar protein 58 [Coniochaeta pulveracea]
MPTFLLQETSAGYGLFKVTDKKLLDSSDYLNRISTADKIAKEVRLKEFVKFDSSAAAVEEIAALLEGKVTPRLAHLLDEMKDEKKASLIVAEKLLGNSISKLPNLNIKPISDPASNDLFRAIREHLAELVPGMQPENFKEMSLGLAHTLSRHKLKFSPDKVDVMIIHAVSLLDDLDKELNTYAMRAREWYGWHFPELAKILTGNLVYAKVILELGLRSNLPNADLSFLEESVEGAVRAAADISMGTEISEEDLENIKRLATVVVDYSNYREDLARYLENRMKAIAPNMTELIGHLVGARLISHAGSLMDLAKKPASTIQILGAEKALFRALKTKHATPKYGMIYHASLVGQASGKNKGKIARQLAAKVALGVRVDALDETLEESETPGALGSLAFAKLSNNLSRLEGKPIKSNITIAHPQPEQFDLKEVRKYNIGADGQMVGEPIVVEEAESKKEKKDKKEKKSRKSLVEEVPEVEMKDGDVEVAPKELSEEDIERLAKEAGISAKKFAKRYAKGEIQLNADGTLKKDGDAEAEPTPKKSKSSKRAREEDEEEATPAKSGKEEKREKKKHKKKHADKDA